MNTVFETRRTLVRQWRFDDLRAYYALRSNPLVMKYIGELFKDIKQAEEALLSKTILDYSKYGYGRYAVVLKKSGDIIGNTGPLYLADLGKNDLAISLFPQYWGLGYGTEILSGCVRYVFEQLTLPDLIGLVDPLNVASSKLLMKIGMTYSGQITYHNEICDLYSLTKQDWSNRPVHRTFKSIESSD
ncbi:MAG: GNAT family N-acetyltransferase [Mastigocoleus sp. MO_167.B18]|nr:GNAT family N-acetyltransferase [Mastigocoleus sp. MO_188.B34]MDJ0696732.1 GNAT family N-acetyltransferase [Mastigocoleus sp. MO_188.B34]MDJ0775063.1 GNAT family N-acetyltransferase [Mastigocoleus sp. MO_167.B18]